jgi:deoxyribodipyrimidine photo-lyase
LLDARRQVIGPEYKPARFSDPFPALLRNNIKPACQDIMTNPADANPVSILWFRKDLRLRDNHALQAALADAGRVICIYVREPDDALAGALGRAQAWWLHHSLKALDADLRRRGNHLVLMTGKSMDIVAGLAARTGASRVVWNRRHDPEGIATDTRIKATLRARGLEVRSFGGQLLHDPTRLMTKTGTPYRVYTPFWRAIAASGEPDQPCEAPDSIPAPDTPPEGEDLASWNLLPEKPDWAASFSALWTPGEQGAIDKLASFIDGAMDGYKEKRDFPGTQATSLLSPHLALGEIAPARIWHATSGLPGQLASHDIIHFRKELVWRDFSWNLLFHNPDLASKNLNRRFDIFPWIAHGDHLKRWQQGMTGYPIVDAGMRQLWLHGWMHNRVRMVVASFLIKDLMIDWRLGEQWFRDTLVDADPASNAASWQWVAGSGADASPFFRVFNPVKQGETFDPDGDYVRTFVPELAGMPSSHIHRPFDAPVEMLATAGVKLGSTYPLPIVSHALARDRALAAFHELKDAS